jgi:hypothetical protein
MPAKKHCGFRLSEAELEAIKAFCEKWYCKNLSEGLGKMALRWKYWDDAGFSGSQKVLDEEIACTYRIQHNGLFYCMYGVPKTVNLNRRIIETLDICRVCKQRKFGLTEKTLIKPALQPTPEPTPKTEPKPEPLTDPKRTDMNKRGMIWCPAGLWVFPRKCELCKTKTFNVWYDCQQQKAKNKNVGEHDGV